MAIQPRAVWCLPRLLRVACLLACGGLAVAGCSQGDNPLAPYQGSRPLDLLRVTQNFTPDIQWVGGRVAAVGVNRGHRAALDSSLVWLRVAAGDDISSFVTVGDETDQGLIGSFGGVPLDSLENGATYTFWLAEASAFEAGLDSTRMDLDAFADTTLTMQLLLRGRSGGDRDLDVEFEVVRDERLTGDRYVVRWTPSTVGFRRLAIRASSTGGFDNLIWHVLVPEGEDGVITPPVTIGVPPAGTQEATPFPSAGFSSGVHTLWAVTDDWTGSFSPSAQGYAYFQIFANNFED